MGGSLPVLPQPRPSHTRPRGAALSPHSPAGSALPGGAAPRHPKSPLFASKRLLVASGGRKGALGRVALRRGGEERGGEGGGGPPRPTPGRSGLPSPPLSPQPPGYGCGRPGHRVAGEGGVVPAGSGEERRAEPGGGGLGSSPEPGQAAGCCWWGRGGWWRPGRAGPCAASPPWRWRRSSTGSTRPPAGPPCTR